MPKSSFPRCGAQSLEQRTVVADTAQRQQRERERLEMQAIRWGYPRPEQMAHAWLRGVAR